MNDYFLVHTIDHKDTRHIVTTTNIPELPCAAHFHVHHVHMDDNEYNHCTCIHLSAVFLALISLGVRAFPDWSLLSNQ